MNVFEEDTAFIGTLFTYGVVCLWSYRMTQSTMFQGHYDHQIYPGLALFVETKRPQFLLNWNKFSLDIDN